MRSASLYESDGDSPRRILCFGDSNTWGYEPGTGRRFAEGVRWPGVLASELGPGFRVVEEGLCSRTTVFEDPLAAGRRGIEALPTALESHAPLDLVVLMLGTNDLKRRYSSGAYEIALGLERLARLVLSSGAGRASPDGKAAGAPALLLVAPPSLGELRENCAAFEGGRAVSLELPARVAALAAALAAEGRAVGHLDAGSAVAAGSDGIHLDPAAHAALGRAVAAKARALLAR